MNREKIEPFLISSVHWLAIPVSFYWLVTLFQRQAWHEFGFFLMGDILFGAWGISGTFHRLYAHKSYSAPSWWHKIGGVLGCLAFQGYSIVWVSVHRYHHAKSDTEKDPHSPQHKGPWWVFFMTTFSKPYIKNSVDLMRDPWHVWMYRNYWFIIIGYISILAIAIEPRAILYAWWMPVSKAFYASTLVNSWCHGWSKKGSPVLNSTVLGILSMGEGWHANHHDKPTSPKCYHGSALLDVGSWPGVIFNRTHSAISPNRYSDPST